MKGRRSRLGDLSASRKKLPDIISDLKDAEQEYVHDLKILCHDFHQGLVSSILPRCMNLVFPNVLQDLLVLHTGVSEDLEGVITDNAVVSGSTLTRVLETFLDHFVLYRRYLLLYEDCIDELTKMLSRNKNLKKFVTKFKAETNKDWKHLYEAPIERLAQFGTICKILTRNMTRFKLDQLRDKKKDIINIIDEIQEALHQLRRNKTQRATLQKALTMFAHDRVSNHSSSDPDIVLYSADVMKDGERMRMHITEEYIVFQGSSSAQIYPVNPAMLEYESTGCDTLQAFASTRTLMSTRSLALNSNSNGAGAEAEEGSIVVWTGVRVLMPTQQALKDVVRAIEEVSQPAHINPDIKLDGSTKWTQAPPSIYSGDMQKTTSPDDTPLLSDENGVWFSSPGMASLFGDGFSEDAFSDSDSILAKNTLANQTAAIPESPQEQKPTYSEQPQEAPTSPKKQKCVIS